jgi:hypothetical protein
MCRVCVRSMSRRAGGTPALVGVPRLSAGGRTMCRLGILSVSNQLTIVAVGPGSA